MKRVKIILKEVKEFKKASILTPLFMIFEVIFETILPVLMGKVIDISDGGTIDMGRILLFGFLMLLLAAGGLWAGVMGGRYGAEASAGFAKNLRMAMY